MIIITKNVPIPTFIIFLSSFSRSDDSQEMGLLLIVLSLIFMNDGPLTEGLQQNIYTTLRVLIMFYLLCVCGLMVANLEFEFRDRRSIPIVCQIMDDGLGQVVYIVHCTIAQTVASSQISNAFLRRSPSIVYILKRACNKLKRE